MTRNERMHGAVACAAAALAIWCAAVSGGCAVDHPLRELQGIYVSVLDPAQTLRLANGQFVFRTTGAHPAFHNQAADRPVPAKDDVVASGPRGHVHHRDDPNQEALMLTVTHAVDAQVLPRAYADLGCPDVSRLGYTGPDLAPGAIVLADVVRQDDGSVALSFSGLGGDGGAVRYTRAAAR